MGHADLAPPAGERELLEGFLDWFRSIVVARVADHCGHMDILREQTDGRTG
ncbi:MAG: hypothetical protein ACR2MB_00920 [Acidimicrobiales bacterium]